MSVIAKGFVNLFRSQIGKSIEASNVWSLTKSCVNNTFTGLAEFKRLGSSLLQMHKKGPHVKKRNKKKLFDGNPFAKAVVLKTLIKKPKKPNSANRKCVLVKLSNGREMVAYVPGIGHNLQEHNIVLCRIGKLKDTPGVKIKCVRGKYDLPHVIKPDPK